jgi:hypothetical protein
MEKYIIFLFKNKVRHKFLKSYKNFNNALKFYETELKKSKNVVFDTQTVNGKNIKYEIALIEKDSDKKNVIYKTDEMGRNIPVLSNDSNFSILKIEDYRISEEIFHIDESKKISVEDLIKKFLKNDSMKMISKLNNKIIIQNDDSYNLFSLKSEYDAERFLTSLEIYMLNNNRRNCLFVRDVSPAQKKYLYKLLSEIGYDKKMLYRKSTTHLKDK